jgi:hypothetical protein
LGDQRVRLIATTAWFIVRIIQRWALEWIHIVAQRIGRRAAFFFLVDVCGRVFLIRFTYPAEMRNYSRRKWTIFIRSVREHARESESERSSEYRVAK